MPDRIANSTTAQKNMKIIDYPFAKKPKKNHYLYKLQKKELRAG
jgi:hypothetical protein